MAETNGKLVETNGKLVETNARITESNAELRVAMHEGFAEAAKERAEIVKSQARQLYVIVATIAAATTRSGSHCSRPLPAASRADSQHNGGLWLTATTRGCSPRCMRC
ncbi:MAG: hypothetical protein F4231_02305 [Acidimicrobiaceae bacterium]|nr:hypothetical protein [Acidimicrobiaceae bacterium]